MSGTVNEPKRISYSKKKGEMGRTIASFIDGSVHGEVISMDELGADPSEQRLLLKACKLGSARGTAAECLHKRN